MNSQYQHYDTSRLNDISIVKVAEKLGEVKRTGTIYRTLCPWHADKHPSLALYERTGENHCHCFVCGNGGSVISFVMQHQQWTFVEACQWLSREFNILSTPSSQYIPKPKPAAKPADPEYTYIPMTMLDELVTADNPLCQCLMRMFQPEAVIWLAEEYHLGCYAMNGDVEYTVFPSIDAKGHVCNLKVQSYETDPTSSQFAHSHQGSCRWLGSIWVSEGLLPKNARFRSECMFGEHLLTRYPDSIVALVESPKNALYGALAWPQIIWVATGNKSMLKRQVLLPLRGRDVIVIPDCDAVEEWTIAIRNMVDLANFTVSDFCQRMAPDGQLKFDIADYLQSQKFMPF